MGVRKVKLARGAFISWILEFEIRAKTKKREIWDNQKFITLVLRVQYLKGQQIDDISSYIFKRLANLAGQSGSSFDHPTSRSGNNKDTTREWLAYVAVIVALILKEKDYRRIQKRLLW